MTTPTPSDVVAQWASAPVAFDPAPATLLYSLWPAAELGYSWRDLKARLRNDLAEKLDMANCAGYLTTVVVHLDHKPVDNAAP